MSGGGLAVCSVLDRVYVRQVRTGSIARDRALGVRVGMWVGHWEREALILLQKGNCPCSCGTRLVRSFSDQVAL
jgi:hypothetical protein